MSHPPELELFFDLDHRLKHAAAHGVVIGVSFVLLGFSWLTDRPDLAAAYRWGALVVAVPVILWTIHEWRFIQHPALRANQEGLLLRNGQLSNGASSRRRSSSRSTASSGWAFAFEAESSRHSTTNRRKLFANKRAG